MRDELVFTKGIEYSSPVFHRVVGDGASFVRVVNRRPGEGVDRGDSKVVEIIVVQCTGTAFVDAVVPFFGNYTVTSSSTIKTKFSTTRSDQGPI
jgi:hypothetical protein